MKILGCDLHAKQQTIAMVDTETGEITGMSLSPVILRFCWFVLRPL
jgi:hypothetical protein